LRTDLPPGGADAVRATVGHLVEVHERTIDDDGLDAWRDHAEVVVAGERLVVRPPWVPIDLDALPPDPVIVSIDPARSWGHGAHPTTRLCLAEVERACRERVGMSVVDLGCGSGVLGIAAARLGATHVHAYDTDPAAVAATLDNARRNQVHDRVDAHQVPDPAEPLADLVGHHDLIVANIGAAALVGLARTILDHVGNDGEVVLSGLLDPVDPGVLAAFDPWRAVRSTTLDGWVAIVLRSPHVLPPGLVPHTSER